LLGKNVVVEYAKNARVLVLASGRTLPTITPLLVFATETTHVGIFVRVTGNVMVTAALLNWAEVIPVPVVNAIVPENWSHTNPVTQDAVAPVPAVVAFPSVKVATGVVPANPVEALKIGQVDVPVPVGLLSGAYEGVTETSCLLEFVPKNAADAGIFAPLIWFVCTFATAAPD